MKERKRGKEEKRKSEGETLVVSLVGTLVVSLALHYSCLLITSLLTGSLAHCLTVPDRTQGGETVDSCAFDSIPVTQVSQFICTFIHQSRDTSHLPLRSKIYPGCVGTLDTSNSQSSESTQSPQSCILRQSSLFLCTCSQLLSTSLLHVYRYVSFSLSPIKQLCQDTNIPSS